MNGPIMDGVRRLRTDVSDFALTLTGELTEEELGRLPANPIELARAANRLVERFADSEGRRIVDAAAFEEVLQVLIAAVPAAAVGQVVQQLAGVEIRRRTTDRARGN